MPAEVVVGEAEAVPRVRLPVAVPGLLLPHQGLTAVVQRTGVVAEFGVELPGPFQVLVGLVVRAEAQAGDGPVRWARACPSRSPTVVAARNANSWARDWPAQAPTRSR